MTVTVNEHGVRDVVMRHEDDDEGFDEGTLRIFSTPHDSHPQYRPNDFCVIWWSSKDDEWFTKIDGEMYATPDVSARVDRQTLIDIRDEIQRVLDAEPKD